MSVSVVVVRALLEALAGVPLDGREFLSAAGFDVLRLEKADGRIQQAEYDALIERALDVTGDPALGLRMGLVAKSLGQSVGGHVVFQASTIREGLELANQFYRLFSDEHPLVVEDRAGAALIKVIGVTGSARCRRFGAEVAASALYGLVQHFAPDARPHFVAFEHPAPARSSEYTRLFHGTERFDQPFTGLAIDRDLMDARQLNRDDALHAVLRVEAAKRLALLERTSSYTDRVREYVTATPDRAHDMTAVARALGVSSRSLRRRLSEEGATFREVVERSLASVAMRLLAEEGKSIQEAAHQMSFSEASAFCRAFKRWAGMTPKMYQVRHGVRARQQTA